MLSKLNPIARFKASNEKKKDKKRDDHYVSILRESNTRVAAHKERQQHHNDKLDGLHRNLHELHARNRLYVMEKYSDDVTALKQQIEHEERSQEKTDDEFQSALSNLHSRIHDHGQGEARKPPHILNTLKQHARSHAEAVKNNKLKEQRTAAAEKRSEAPGNPEEIQQRLITKHGPPNNPHYVNPKDIMCECDRLVAKHKEDNKKYDNELDKLYQSLHNLGPAKVWGGSDLHQKFKRTQRPQREHDDKLRADLDAIYKRVREHGQGHDALSARVEKFKNDTLGSLEVDRAKSRTKPPPVKPWESMETSTDMVDHNSAHPQRTYNVKEQLLECGGDPPHSEQGMTTHGGPKLRVSYYEESGEHEETVKKKPNEDKIQKSTAAGNTHGGHLNEQHDARCIRTSGEIGPVKCCAMNSPFRGSNIAIRRRCTKSLRSRRWGVVSRLKADLHGRESSLMHSRRRQISFGNARHSVTYNLHVAMPGNPSDVGRLRTSDLQSVACQSLERGYSGLLVVHQFLEAIKAALCRDVFRAHEQDLAPS